MVTSSSLGRSPFAISSSNEAAANPYGKTRPKNVSSKGDFELGAQAPAAKKRNMRRFNNRETTTGVQNFDDLSIQVIEA